ncbi:hypothetical protein AOQ84DRAFT_303141, partial [Glonium stellatum]
PPYAPQTASLGGVPSVIPDVPITGVFLLLYVVFWIVHFVIFKKNMTRGHKFLFSPMMLAFCIIRIATMSLRIAWAFYPRNINLGIAAQIFVYVGTVILFIMNWFFAQRIVRAQHPRLGWSTIYRIIHRAGLLLLILCLIMLIAAALLSFFTLSANIHRIDRYLQLAGSTYFAAFSFGPILLVLISLAIPHRGTEKFGEGRMRSNITVLLLAASVLSLGAAFRAGTNYLPPVPIRDPSPWYFSKICFYVFDFLVEILVVIFYAMARFDLRFYVPDGAKGPGDYTSTDKVTEHPVESQETIKEYETDIFSDARTLADSLKYPGSTLALDSRTGVWKVKRVSGSSRGSECASARYSIIDATSTYSHDYSWAAPLYEEPVPLLSSNALNIIDMPNIITVSTGEHQESVGGPSHHTSRYSSRQSSPVRPTWPNSETPKIPEEDDLIEGDDAKAE